MEENNKKVLFGDVLRGLRKDRGITQQYLAVESGLNRKTILKFEKNEKSPTVDQILRMSDVLECNLLEYYTSEEIGVIIDVHGIKSKIREALVESNSEEYYALFKKYKDDKHFREGENLQLMKYCESTYEYEVNKNYEKSLEIALEGVKIENPYFEIDSFANYKFNETSYRLINSIGVLYVCLGDLNKSEIVFNNAHENITRYYFNKDGSYRGKNNYILRHYIATLNNQATAHFDNEEYMDSLEVIDYAITLSLDNDELKNLGYLYWVRFECKYKLLDMRESKKSLMFALTYLYNSKDYGAIERLRRTVKKNYKPFLDIMDLIEVRKNASYKKVKKNNIY